MFSSQDENIAVRKEEDEYEDDYVDEGNRRRRVKRSPRGGSLTTFSDLKDLVSQSKALGSSVVNTNERVSRDKVVSFPSLK